MDLSRRGACLEVVLKSDAAVEGVDGRGKLVDFTGRSHRCFNETLCRIGPCEQYRGVLVKLLLPIEHSESEIQWCLGGLCETCPVPE